MQDLRYAIRRLRKDWTFSLVAIATLALGIGVVTAAFAVVDAVVLAPIAPGQDRVVRIWQMDPLRGDFHHAFSYHEFTTVRERARSFDALAAIQYADASRVALTISGQPTPASITPVSSSFFSVLTDTPPLLGRWLQVTDDERGAELNGVVSERFWRQALSANPAAVGSRVRMADERTLVVVGVAPAALGYPIDSDVWVAITHFFDGRVGRFDATSRQFSQFDLIGRLADGVSSQQAVVELEALNRNAVSEYPADYKSMDAVVRPLLNVLLGNSRPILLLLFAAAGLVLVIAGVNVSALLLMRAARRRRELAVRLALGATRMRLAREDAMNALVLALPAALLGALGAQLLLVLLRASGAGTLPRIETAVLDVRVLGFCAAATCAWVLTLGLAPGWAGRKLSPTQAGDLTSRSGGRTAGLRWFTIAEIATAVVVVITGGLLLRSFVHLQSIDRGFNAANLVVVPLLSPAGSDASPAAVRALYRQLTARIDALPGVVVSAPIQIGPGTGDGGLSASMIFEGQTPDEAKTNPWATFDPVMPSLFRTVGIRIIEGRSLTDADREGGAPVVVVSESVAHRYWPGQRAIGKHVRIDASFPPSEVVGVAADVRYRELTKTWLTVYFAADQFFYFNPMGLVVRTASAPVALMPSIRAAILAVEPRMAIEVPRNMDVLLAEETSRPRVAFVVMLVFATVAMLLSAVGVYSVLSYEVSHRRRELAVRSALGASPARLFGAVVTQSLRLALVGVITGTVIAAFATHAMASVLFEVQPGDPGTFMVGAGLILTITLLSACLPAMRAAATDPIRALRSE